MLHAGGNAQSSPNSDDIKSQSIPKGHLHSTARLAASTYLSSGGASQQVGGGHTATQGRGQGTEDSKNELNFFLIRPSIETNLPGSSCRTLTVGTADRDKPKLVVAVVGTGLREALISSGDKQVHAAQHSWHKEKKTRWRAHHNHRITEWPGLQRTTMLIQFQPPAMCRVSNQQPRLPRATSSLALENQTRKRQNQKTHNRKKTQTGAAELLSQISPGRSYPVVILQRQAWTQYQQSWWSAQGASPMEGSM